MSELTKSLYVHQTLFMLIPLFYSPKVLTFGCPFNETGEYNDVFSCLFSALSFYILQFLILQAMGILQAGVDSSCLPCLDFNYFQRKMKQSKKSNCIVCM